MIDSLSQGDASPQRKVYTVSRLNQEVQQLLERGFGTLWLQGELSNLSKPASGHLYFSLKDSRAQIRCAMFRGNNRYLDFEPKAGDAVLARGRLGLYAARGDYQLIVEHLEPAGEGKLQARFEATLKRLKAEGWFDQTRKRALPASPAAIGVVTSPTGAALQDVLKVLGRRYPQATVVIYPTATQGAQAAPEIVRALGRAARRREVDVLLLVRGGGSLEDLWGFNEVSVAEAVLNSPVPVVSGVGHEVDVTIADHVADLRAPTPSAAAELATPDQGEHAARLKALSRSLSRWPASTLPLKRQWYQNWQARLQSRHPQRLIEERGQQIDGAERRLHSALRQHLNDSRQRLQQCDARLAQHSPAQRVVAQSATLDQWRFRLNTAWQRHQENARRRLELAARGLHGVSPLTILDRGYALVSHDKQLIRDASAVKPGEQVHIRLANGSLEAEILTTNPDTIDG